jgi:predicted nucleic acid-binding protein
MKVLVDANVVLDVLLDHQPHFAASVAVWSASETGTAQGQLAAHAVATIHFLIRREHGAAEARKALSLLPRVFGVAPVDEGIIREAFELQVVGLFGPTTELHSPDFEDSVTAVAAQRAGCDLIVTRDPKGFRGSLVSVLAPEAAAPLLG